MRKGLVLLFMLVYSAVHATDFTVTNTNDSGNGSLRNAITLACATPGTSHQILFNIPQSDPNFNSTQGVWTIHPLSTMPYINKGNITIDGNSQTLNQGNTNTNGPEIVLDGNKTIDFAFHIFNVSGVTIRGFVISRFTYGIQISQVTPNAAQNNIIKGNYIGTNYNGSDTLRNYIGIEIMGGPQNNIIGGIAADDRNIVSGNNYIGIRIVNSNNNTVIGNYVGVDRTGQYALRNYDGISIEGNAKYNTIGGYSIGERNLVSGNVAYGIPVFGAGCDNNVIIGNYIGTNVSGTQAIPNTYGVLFDDGAKYNTLGGKHSGAGNLISGNSAYGVFIYNNSTNSDTVTGNLIGTKAGGTAALPNITGIVIDGIPKYHIIDSNVISGNLQQGIVIHATGTDYNVITRNKIGTDITGTLAVPNGIDGIRIGEGPQHNSIGKAPDLGNLIAFNGGCGVSVMTTGDIKNKISGNSIFNNGTLGIDLYPIGVTANDAGDADSGPNNLMNFPVIDDAHYNEVSGNFEISGHLDTPAPHCTIELFRSDNDASGYGEGEKFLTSVMPDNAGNFNAIIVAGINGGNKVTATATDSAGNTSEFSASAIVSGINDFNKEILTRIFPNPSTGIFTINVPESETPMSLSIYDNCGKIISTRELQYSTEVIDLSGCAEGIYFIKLIVEGKSYYQKIAIYNK